MSNFNQQHQRVLNQYNAETINLFIKQSEGLARIQWRDLEVLPYTVREDSENFRRWCVLDCCRALHEVFSQVGYRRFNALYEPRIWQGDDGQKYFQYYLICHEIRFLSSARKRASDRIILMSKLQGMPREEIEKIAMECEVESQDFFRNWSINTQIDFDQPGVFEFVYDPDSSSMNVRSLDGLSLDPKDYEHEVQTTSEVLAYIGATRALRVGFMGNIEDTLNNFSLFKIAVEILDKTGIKLQNLRINSKNYEEWDYRNPEIEAELSSKKTSWQRNT